jgi:hypothetical protein
MVSGGVGGGVSPSTNLCGSSRADGGLLRSLLLMPLLLSCLLCHTASNVGEPIIKSFLKRIKVSLKETLIFFVGMKHLAWWVEVGAGEVWGMGSVRCLRGSLSGMWVEAALRPG